MKTSHYLIAAMSIAHLSMFASDAVSNSFVRLKPSQGYTTSTEKLYAELEKYVAWEGTGRQNQPYVRNLRVELARRGDQDERQRIFQEMKGTNSEKRFAAIDDAARLGDREAVYHLAELLSDTNGYFRISDVVRSPPSIVAALHLSRMIENPPVPPSGKRYDNMHDHEEDFAIWPKWWQEHKAEFAEFEKQGDILEQSPEISSPPITATVNEAETEEIKKSNPTIDIPENPITEIPEQKSSRLWLWGIGVAVVLIGGVTAWRIKRGSKKSA